MRQSTIDGILLARLIGEGAKHLKQHVDEVNALNVFPVPDGDTGTNMDLSFSSGFQEMERYKQEHIGLTAKSLSKGLLMGARGNSGVILSQLFRGFSKKLQGHEQINAQQFVLALESGVEMAYKAVVKPVEGTILTVAKDAASAGRIKARTTDDLALVMEAIYEESKASLQRTPQLLEVLRKVGVVDSGGQGLVYIYEGFLNILSPDELNKSMITEDTQKANISETVESNKQEHVRDEVLSMMESGVLSEDDIHYGYCTEFMIRMNDEGVKTFQEEPFRDQLSDYGDSLLVISDDELIKVHIHAEHLDKVMSIAQSYGELDQIKIENMREQFRQVLQTGLNRRDVQANSIPLAVVTVAMGEGINQIFKSIGAHSVIDGGQSMNPSTQDFLQAIDNCSAESVILLPNNKNVFLAAKQAAELAEIRVTVVPTKDVSQGLAALLRFDSEGDIDKNTEEMTKALDDINTGQVTYAVRDTTMDGLDIKKGHFMGMTGGDIVTTSTDIEGTVEKLIEKMFNGDEELLTLIYGQDVNEDQALALQTKISSLYEDLTIELYNGGQPLYAYYISLD